MRTSAVLIGLLLQVFSFMSHADTAGGEKLFHSTSLGTNGKSCHSCHANGQGDSQVSGVASE